jgi:hypothetical protein
MMGKLKDNLRDHIVDSTVLLAESFPVFAAYEIYIVGMSLDVSQNSKMLAAGLTFAGLGWAFGKGKKLWDKAFDIVGQTKERVKSMRDFLYLAAFNLAALPPIYYVSGERDLEKLAVGTGIGMGVRGLNGLVLGPYLEMFRDLIGLKPCERRYYPKVIRNQSSTVKKTMAAGLVAGSAGLMGLIYS